MKKTIFTFIIFTILTLALALFVSCEEEPIITSHTRAERTTLSPSSDIPTTTKPTDTSSIVSQSSIAATSTSPITDSPDLPHFPLELETEDSYLFVNGKNPCYIEEKQGFACFFKGNDTYYISEDDICKVKITCDEKTTLCNASIDLSLAGFVEEGLLVGAGFTLDFDFEDGKEYTIEVEILSDRYLYSFSFLYVTTE